MRSKPVEQELRKAGACDTCCNRTIAGQEWMNDYVNSLKKLKLVYRTLPRHSGQVSRELAQSYVFPWCQEN